jgi:hypothetical protein
MRKAEQFSLDESKPLAELVDGLREFFEGRRHLGDRLVCNPCPLTSRAHHEPVTTQRVERLLDGSGREVVQLGELADRRQAITRSQPASGDVRAERVGEHLMSGAAIRGRHGAQPTRESTSVSQRLTQVSSTGCIETVGTREDCDMEREPTPAELAAIDAEWPVIAAEIAVVDAEIAAARAGDRPSELDRRRLRRAQARLAREIVDSTRRPNLDGAA